MDVHENAEVGSPRKNLDATINISSNKRIEYSVKS